MLIKHEVKPSALLASRLTIVPKLAGPIPKCPLFRGFTVIVYGTKFYQRCLECRM